MNMKNIVVFGATGYIGARLIEQLGTGSSQIFAVTRKDVKVLNKLNKNKYIKFVNVDNIEQELNNVGRVDIVINNAGAYQLNGKSSLGVMDGNVIFPMKILMIAKMCQAGTFINTGTALNPGVNEYSSAKHLFLKLAQVVIQDFPIRFINFKSAYVYGPGDHPHKVSSHLVSAMVANKEQVHLTSGEQKLDFIYITDYVEAYCLMLHNESLFEVGYNEVGIGTGYLCSLRRFAELVSTKSESKTSINYGAVLTRANEGGSYNLDISMLQRLKWSPKYDLPKGVDEVIAAERLKHLLKVGGSRN